VVCVDVLRAREERKPYKIQRFHNIEVSDSLTSCIVSPELSQDQSFPVYANLQAYLWEYCL
jgi:hypothetical protein